MLEFLKTPLSHNVKAVLLVALNGGLVAAAASVGAYDAQHFDLFSVGVIKHLLGVFASGAFYGLVLYLRQPNKPWDGHERRD